MTDQQQECVWKESNRESGKHHTSVIDVSIHSITTVFHEQEVGIANKEEIQSAEEELFS